MDYDLYRSKRKTIAVTIERDGNVVVRAPLTMPQYQIDRFIQSKYAWIEDNVKRAKERASKYSFAGLEEGCKLLYFGQIVDVKLTEGNTKLRDGILYVPNKPNRRDHVIRMMKRDLKKFLLNNIPVYETALHVKAASVKVGSAKTRWGSCSSTNNLNFSYRLAMCPPVVINYVIVHELSHIRHHDHSARFWSTVETVCPNWRIYKKWLDDNSYLMEIL